MKGSSLKALGGCGLAMCALFVLAPLTAAFGATGVCRTDPTVYLSNGYNVQMWDSINTDLSNVTGVSYELHVPTGVSMNSVSYDSTGYLENVQVVADQKKGQYVETTTVNTSVKTTDTGYAIRQDGTTASSSSSTGKPVTMHWST